MGEFDAVGCAAGVARFGMLDDLTDADYRIGRPICRSATVDPVACLDRSVDATDVHFIWCYPVQRIDEELTPCIMRFFLSLSV